jgi:hypothetical protein
VDRPIGIATGYWLDYRGSIPDKGKIFLFSIPSRLALGPTQPSRQRIPMAITPGVKRPGLESDRLPPCSAEVKNDGAIPPLHHKSSWHSA